MNSEIFSERLKGMLQAAEQAARNRDHQAVTPMHLAQVLFSDAQGLAARLLSLAGGLREPVVAAISERLGKEPKISGPGAAGLHATPALEQLMRAAETRAKQAGDRFVTIEQLLLALAADEEAIICHAAGIKFDDLERAVADLRQGRKADHEASEARYEVLATYTQDLTEQARKGALDPVIGRDEEIRRSIQVLARRTKNNPVLIGEPGVGKTAIVEGLAQRIAAGDVPGQLAECRLLGLDLSSLVAGAKFRGEFEQRLNMLLEELAASDAIIFIDELHSLVGAGQAEGALDAAHMLKPALARGTLHCVGATTLDEYRQKIEKDPALARRFQPIFVQPPGLEDTISILRGLKERYELHHGVRITDAALVAAARLSERYVSDRFQPDKAIDLIDEAASSLRIAVDSKPEEVDALDRRLIQLRIEETALARENLPEGQERLQALRQDIARVQEQSTALNAHWQEEKKSLTQRRELKKELETARSALEIAQRQGELERAGRLRFEKIPQLERRSAALEQQAPPQLLDEGVGEEAVAAVVARWTGIPVARMLRGERARLLEMEQALGQQVVGQDEAISAVARAVRRGRAGLADATRPLASFLLLGPTGVGKTQLAKSLATFLFDDAQSLMRLDMSEYMEKHAVARMIGAPPGYVGYEEGGSLTEALRRRPYQVLLFDEIEKAHPDVFNLLLQVLDDGRLTDGQGRTVDFRHSLVVMTSNIGALELLAAADRKQEDELSPELRAQVEARVQAQFRPEFINRIDEIILLRRLDTDAMRRIVRLELKEIAQRLAQAHRITMTWDPEVETLLAADGYQPQFGARPLKRLLQRRVLDPLAEALLSGRLAAEDSLRLKGQDGDRQGDDRQGGDRQDGELGLQIRRTTPDGA